MKEKEESLDKNASKPNNGTTEGIEDLSSIHNASYPKPFNAKSQDDRARRNEDVERQIESKYNGDFKLIKFDEFKELAPEFAEWIYSVSRYGNVDNMCLIFKNKNPDEELRIRVRFFTNDNEYSIVGVPRKDNKDKKGYLGCTVSSRKSRVGETWTRGNDLPDGKYNSKTWNDILNRIVAYEMKTLQCWIK